MKRITILILAILILLVSEPANALGPVTIYGGTGFSNLSSPDNYKTTYENGYHVTLGVGFSMAPALQIVPKFEYHSFSPEEVGDITKMKIAMYGADARLSIGLPTLSFKPVLLAGIGLADIEKDASLTGIISEVPKKTTDFYYNLGAGIEMKRLTFHVKYVSVSSDGQTISYIPLTIGLKF